MKNVILVGFMGTGKTVVGRRLARTLDWRFVDVDQQIEQHSGKTISDIFAQQGEAAFRKLEREAITRILSNQKQVIATGGGAFVSEENQSILKSGGFVITLQAAPESIVSRLKRTRSSRPLLSKAENPEERIKALLKERSQAYDQAHALVDTTDLSAEQVVKRLMELLSRHL